MWSPHLPHRLPLCFARQPSRLLLPATAGSPRHRSESLSLPAAGRSAGGKCPLPYPLRRGEGFEIGTRRAVSGGAAWKQLAVLVVVLFMMVAGCRQAPSRVVAPTWDPEGYAEAVLAKLDKNGDGVLDKGEFSAAPGLAWGAKPIDKDKNGSLSRQELVDRFAIYKKMRLGLTSNQMYVYYKGRPLAGAKVTLVPEFFLEGVIEPASGEVFEDGMVDPRIPGVEPSGLRVGYYRVVIESPRVKIPAKYSSAETTPLGVEVSPVSDPETSGMIQLVVRD